MPADQPLARRYDLLVLDYAGVCTPSHAEFAQRSTLATSETDERPGCLPVIRLAHSLGLTVVVLSNEIDPAWIERSSALSAVDHVIACTDNGILKPDRRAFQRALLLTNCAADRSLVVDDAIDNVRGAQAAGLTAILFDTTDADASWASVTQALVADPDVTRGQQQSG